MSEKLGVLNFGCLFHMCSFIFQAVRKQEFSRLSILPICEPKSLAGVFRWSEKFMSSSGNSMNRSSAIKWRWSSFTVIGVVASPSPAKRTISNNDIQNIYIYSKWFMIQNDPFDLPCLGEGHLDWWVKLLFWQKKIMDFFPLNIQGTKQRCKVRFFQWTVPLLCLDLLTSAKQDPGFEVSTASGVKSKCSWTATAATENLYQFLQVKIWSESQ